MYYQNVRGLRTKTHVFYRNLCCSSYDVIVLSETNLNSSVRSSELFDDRYNVYRRDREQFGFHREEDGGGVLVAVIKKLQSKRINNWESMCEDLWILIDLSPSNKLALCAVYLRSPLKKSHLEHFMANYNAVSENHSFSKCIIGDINLSCIDWNLVYNSSVDYQLTPTAQEFIDFTMLNNLKQCNNVRNQTDRVLDLVLVDGPLFRVSESRCVLSKIDPYHPPLEINVALEPGQNLKGNEAIKKLNFRKADYDSINDFLGSIDWNQVIGETGDVNDMLESFYEVVNSAVSRFVPLTKTKKNNYPPWFNKRLKKMLLEKNKFRRRFAKYRNPLDSVTFELLRKRCDNFAVKCYNLYVKDIENKITENPKYFWSYIKAKRGGTSTYPATMTDGTVETSDGLDICNLFASQFSSAYLKDGSSISYILSDTMKSISLNSDDFSSLIIDQESIEKKLKSLDVSKGAGPDGIPPLFFVSSASKLISPLHRIFNVSLQSGSFPKMWKQARVVPVYKSDDKALVNNYRPISILSVLAKVFESLVCPLIQNYFKRFLTDHQHGFVRARSTCTNLVTFAEALVESVDANQQTDVVYTDFSKAFDRVSHGVLIEKLKAYGFSGSFLCWLKSYLKERTFHVVVNGYSSKTYNIASGVPQGSHLGPILFNIFVNDVTECFQQSTPFMFADDLKIARVVSSYTDMSLLQEDLNRLSKWCKDNCIKLNSNKCLHIKFTRKLKPLNTSYYIDEIRLREEGIVKDLGITLDSKLTYLPHIDDIVKRASRMLGFVIRNGKVFKNSRTKILLYNSLVRSILEYCSTVWRPHYSTHILRLERVQKRFLWHLAYSDGYAKKLPSYADRAKHFKISVLNQRRDILDIAFLFKILRNQIDCPQLVSKFRFRVPARLPRLPITPLVAPLRRTVLGSNSCIARLCKICNSCSSSTDIHFDSVYALKKQIHELSTK